MKQKKRSKLKHVSAKKVSNKATKKNVKKIISVAKSIAHKKSDVPVIIPTKYVKPLEIITADRKERQYKFDERLVPYYLGGDTKEGNLSLRAALIKLGKTIEMTELFIAMKSGNLGYRDDGKEVFVKALYTIIKGHDEIGLAHVYEDDIQAIHNNNLKTFNEFWDAMAKSGNEEDEFSGFSN